MKQMTIEEIKAMSARYEWGDHNFTEIIIPMQDVLNEAWSLVSVKEFERAAHYELMRARVNDFYDKILKLNPNAFEYEAGDRSLKEELLDCENAEADFILAKDQLHLVKEDTNWHRVVIGFTCLVKLFQNVLQNEIVEPYLRLRDYEAKLEQTIKDTNEALANL